MDWFLERARALGVEHAPPEPLLLGRHLLALGVAPGPRVGEILKADLRAAARRHDHDARRRVALATRGPEEALNEASSPVRPFPSASADCESTIRSCRSLNDMSTRAIRSRRRVMLCWPCCSPSAATRPLRRCRPRTSPSGGSSWTREPLSKVQTGSEHRDAASGSRRSNLPTRALGLVFGAHLYPVRLGAVALGIGGEVMRAQAQDDADTGDRRRRGRADGSQPHVVRDTADLVQFRKAPGLELHQRRHWRDGVHRGTRGRAASGAGVSAKTFNYGGGARWFTKKHLALSWTCASTRSTRSSQTSAARRSPA